MKTVLEFIALLANGASTALVIIWLLIGIFLTVWFSGWILSAIIDKVRKSFRVFRYILEYLYYVKEFKDWLKEKKNSTLTSL